MINSKSDLRKQIFAMFLEANSFKTKPDFKTHQIIYEQGNNTFTENQLRWSQAYQGFIDGFTGQIHLYNQALNMPVQENCSYSLQYNLGKLKKGRI